MTALNKSRGLSVFDDAGIGARALRYRRRIVLAIAAMGRRRADDEAGTLSHRLRRIVRITSDYCDILTTFSRFRWRASNTVPDAALSTEDTGR